jgi:retron-type reverse transcriptase
MNLFQRLLRFLFGSPVPPEIFSQPSVPPSQPSASTSTSTATPDAAEFSYRSTTVTASSAEPLPDVSADPYFTSVPEPSTLASKTKFPSKNALDAGSYLPITRQEIKDAAKGQNLFANFSFGRRDLIPPASDLRTQLIDRALVTHGLLSPEQIRQVHEAGERMDEIKDSVNLADRRAALAGEAAVKADREALARLKALKKAEAAERKRLRAEAISHRKATDITFLGRGVSGRLGNRTSDIAALRAAGLPALSTPADLAEALGISIPNLRWLAYHSEAATRVHYVQFTTPKKSGGVRTLSAPHQTLAEAQRWIFQEIVARLPVEESAHGFVPGRSILTNAQPHARRALVVNLDLEGFFPSIGFARVRAVFQRLGYSPAVATILGLLCTECPRRRVVYDGVVYHVATGPRGLPQGACTSPGLSNQVARRLDRRLAGLAQKFGLVYTRYADDLTFSGDEALATRVGYLMARVRHIVQDCGLAVNEVKSRVLRRNAAQMVTGLVVNDRPGVRRSEVRRIRAILHRARTEGLASQNRQGHENFSAWLRGKIAFVAMVRPELGAKLKAELEALGG